MVHGSRMRGMLVLFLWIFIQGSRPSDLERVLEGVQSMVSASMNEALTKPYVREEVDVAIK